MAFVRAAAGWFRAKTRGGAGPGQAPPHKPPWAQCAPPLRYQARFTGSLGSCPGNWKPSLPPRGPCLFSWTTLPSRSPTLLQRQSAQGRPGDLGLGRGAGHGSTLGGAGLGGCDAQLWTGSPVGTQACAPPVRLRVLLWLKLPHPAPKGKLGPSGFNSLSLD